MKKIYKQKAVAFTGVSNSGKTTTIVKLANILQDKNNKVVIIKHDPKDKAVFDKEGKDSFKFSQTKADVVITSPLRTTIFKNSHSTIDEIISAVTPFDYLLVEGLKTVDLPRICICRQKIDKNYFEVSDTLCIDDTIDKTLLPKDINILDLNDTDEILSWIDINAKEVRYV